MSIPAHVCAALACQAELAKQDMESLLDAAADDDLPWVLRDNAARAAFVEAVYDERVRCRLHAVRVIGTVASLRYFELGDVRAALAIPDEGVPMTPVPTSALVNAARAWLLEQKIVNARDISDVDAEYRGQVIVFVTGDAATWDPANLEKVVCSLAGYKLPVADATTVAPEWTNYGRAEFEVDSLLNNTHMMSGSLLQEVLSEERVRWRFIGLYRIFEAAYLVGLRDSISANFLRSPKESLAMASNALESELKTFQSLVTDKALEPHFELIRAAVDGDQRNRFLHALKHAVRRSGASRHAKGVEYIYKMRCAVVHAGQHDVVFDRFDDASQGLALIIVLLERAVLSLLGIRYRAD